MSLAERRWLRLFTLCALFFAQGIPWGFLAITLPAYLAERGLDIAVLGSVSAMSYWPYVFKFAGGPLIDLVSIRRLGRRRSWILFAQGMMAVTMLGLALVGDVVAHVDLLIALVLVHTVFNALQNVAADALAIDLLDPDERGRANGFMYGSKYAGGLIGGVGIAHVLDYVGFRTAVLAQAAILGAIFLIPLFVRERGGPAPPHAKPSEIWRVLRRVYALRSPWTAAGAMLVMTIAGGMLGVVAPAVLVQDLHWNTADYANLVGGYGLLLGVAGSSVAGLIAERVGHRRLAAAGSLLLAADWLAFAAGHAWWHSDVFVYAIGLTEPFAQSMMIVALWSVCMSVTTKQTGATQFAAYTSLTNLGIIIGQRALAANAAAWWTYPGVYAAAGIVQIAVIAILPFIDPKQVRRELRE